MRTFVKESTGEPIKPTITPAPANGIVIATIYGDGAPEGSEWTEITPTRWDKIKWYFSNLWDALLGRAPSY